LQNSTSKTEMKFSKGFSFSFFGLFVNEENKNSLGFGEN
jgi:hypothetical protein